MTEPYHAPEPRLPDGPPAGIGPDPACESPAPPEPITLTALSAVSETLEEVVREGARQILVRGASRPGSRWSAARRGQASPRGSGPPLE